MRITVGKKGGAGLEEGKGHKQLTGIQTGKQIAKGGKGYKNNKIKVDIQNKGKGKNWEVERRLT